MSIFHIVIIPLSFLLGSIPFGLIIGKIIAGIDITRRGSGNIGATNVARELGIGWGIITLLLDISKGFFPLMILIRLNIPYHDLLLVAMSMALLSGNICSPFLRFRGGKGVSTGFGIFLALSPGPAIISLFIFLLTVYLFNYISLGSIAGACFMPLILVLMDKPAAVITISSLTAALILISHSKNLMRIMSGHERKWRNRS